MNRWTKKELKILRKQTSLIASTKGIAPGVWHIISAQMLSIDGTVRSARACEGMFYRISKHRFKSRWAEHDLVKLKFIVLKQYQVMRVTKMSKLDWKAISKAFRNRTPEACKQKYYTSIA